MQDHGDDAALLRRQRTFLEQIERSIRAVNRETIHETIPELDRDSFVRMALRVARLRAGYLQVALAADGESDEETAAWARRLREYREAFEEARDAFDALQRAIERGYVDVGLHAS